MLLKLNSKRIIFKRLGVISQITIIVQEKGSMVFLQGNVIYSRELKLKTADFVLYLSKVYIDLWPREDESFVACFISMNYKVELAKHWLGLNS